MNKLGNIKQQNLPNNELFVRIPLKNIKFEDSYEQLKFEKLIIEIPQETILEIEKLLSDYFLELSFN